MIGRIQLNFLSLRTKIEADRDSYVCLRRHTIHHLRRECPSTQTSHRRSIKFEIPTALIYHHVHILPFRIKQDEGNDRSLMSLSNRQNRVMNWRSANYGRGNDYRLMPDRRTTSQQYQRPKDTNATQ